MTTPFRAPQPVIRLPDAPIDDPAEQQFRRALEQAITLAAAPDMTPEVLDVSGSLDVNGVLTLNVQCNAYSQSFKVAVSTSGAPTAATVRAASVTVGQAASVTFAGPYAFGTIIYVSALAYYGANGDGMESILYTTRNVNTTDSPALEVEITQTASDGHGLTPQTTFTVKITDPTNTATGTASVTVDWQGLASLHNDTLGAAAATWNATIGSTYTFTATLNQPQRGAGYAKFKATKTGWYRGYGTWYSSSADAETTPDIVIAIGSNQSSSDTTAKASMQVNAPSNSAAIYWYATKTGTPSQGTVVASGTLVTGGAPYAVSDLGVTLSFGETVYVGVVAKDSFGTITGFYSTAKATRSNLAATKTAFFLGPHSLLSSGNQIEPLAIDGYAVVYGAHVTDDEWRCAYVGAPFGGAGTYLNVFQVSPALPDGVTITGIAWEFYDANTGGAGGSGCFGDLIVAAVGSSFTGVGASASVHSTNAAAWETRTASCSVSTTSKRIMMRTELFGDYAKNPVDQRFRSISITYIPADPQGTR